MNTNSKGQVNLACNIVPGDYVVFIKGKKDAYGSADVQVKKATSKLTAAKKTFKRSLKIKKYSIALKDNNNKVMKSKKVTLKVNGKTYAAKTNSKGKAKLQMKFTVC